MMMANNMMTPNVMKESNVLGTISLKAGIMPMETRRVEPNVMIAVMYPHKKDWVFVVA